MPKNSTQKITGLKIRRDELIKKINDSQKELEHIDYALRFLGADDEAEDTGAERFVSKINTTDLIIDLLRNEHGKPIGVKELYYKFKREGGVMSLRSFNVRMSLLAKSETKPIKRVGYGLYKYDPKFTAVWG